MPDYALELRDVSKSYDQFVAVDHLSLNIPKGSVYGLLGPNGAGKTSSLRMMIGITLPDSGEVRIFGQTFQREHLKRIGYLPEERGFYKRMKLGEHLVLLAELQGVQANEARRRATEWCNRLQLSEWIDKKVEELSKGMQQKAQFIASILHDPELLILDEPFSGLDPANAVVLKDVLLELKKAGKTILFSTHRMDTVERLCDAICLVNRGRSVLEGDLRSIKSRYGKNNVQMEYEGDGDFLQSSELVQSFNNYGNYVEVKMRPGADVQALLQSAINKVRLNKFEVVEPSLEEIFIDVVGNHHA
jgi:ABC-2 type transport system ATP-binding protein